MSHARLWHFYHDELKGNRTVTFKNGAVPGTPRMPHNASHLAAVQHYNENQLGAFLDHLVLGLDYPEASKQTQQGYTPFSKPDLAYVRDTMDIVAFDAYTSQVIYPIGDLATCAANNASTNPYYPNCVGVTVST
ncbi:hypothetical protein LTR50_007345 [Elasticomyces elasticus]|nr:hypothetical protein LTR50_007345 [Elasticomyces elasticus]